MTARTFILFACLLLLAPLARADDWPQWGGPQRDNVYRETGVITSIPKDGLPIRWRIPISSGYAGPAVANGRVFVTDFVLKRSPSDKRGAINGVERVHCLNAADGKP